jgi:hypothetical protein
MSLWDRMLSGARKMVLVEDRIDRLEKSVDKLRDKVDGQEQRLAQIEFIIFGPMHPDNRRLPR